MPSQYPMESPLKPTYDHSNYGVRVRCYYVDHREQPYLVHVHCEDNRLDVWRGFETMADSALWIQTAYREDDDLIVAAAMALWQRPPREVLEHEAVIDAVLLEVMVSAAATGHDLGEWEFYVGETHRAQWTATCGFCGQTVTVYAGGAMYSLLGDECGRKA